MRDLQREHEAAIAQFRMRDAYGARARPGGPAQPPAPHLDEIARAAEAQGAVLDADLQIHSDAAADVLLETSRAGKTFRRMDDLRESVAARVEAGPDLAAGRHVLRHGHDARNVH